MTMTTNGVGVEVGDGDGSSSSSSRSSDYSSEDDERMEFCNGMSMTMSMGGFQSALFTKDHPADCITFLFTNWKLDHPGKYVCAMIVTFIAAVVSEGISHCQPLVRNYYLARTTRTPKGQRKTIMTLLYGLQQLLGWLLMLISMTFSIELFASVVVGLFVGKLIFPVDLQASQTQTPNQIFDDSGVGDSDTNTNDINQSDDNNRLLLEAHGSSDSAVRRRRR